MKKRKVLLSVALFLLCVLFCSVFAQAGQKKTKRSVGIIELSEVEEEIDDEDDEDESEVPFVLATEGFQYKIKTTGMKFPPVSAIKTGNKKIACVKNGKLYAVKRGKTTISYKYKDKLGKTATRTAELEVEANQHDGEDFVNCHYTDYKSGKPALEELKTYYKGKKLVSECAVINTGKTRLKKFSSITVTIKIGKKVIAKKTFKNIKLNLKPHGKKKVTFKFSASKKNYDLAAADIEDTFSWTYRAK